VEPVRVVAGTALPLDRSDVDTDQIIPAEYLKRIERSGFGQFLFAEWRKDPGFVLNDDRFSGASILLAGPNFGSGSSREHAPWALEDAGFRAIIAPSFADIFRTNCTKIGLLPVELPAESVRALLDAVLDDPSTEIVVDLESRTVRAPAVEEVFDLDEYTRWRLLEGLDDVGLTLRHEEEIAAYEASRPGWLPSSDAASDPGPR
jgi:3-isopropylmalate/(R)-2-methylmalate dehydratase small subunit